ncbi:MAG: acetate--CoA ligase family protein [Myxococcota bacterium]
MAYTLSEFDSKRLLAEAGIPVPWERLARSAREAAEAAEQIGYPVALKLCGPGIAHKTERGLVRLEVIEEEFALQEAEELLERRRPGEEDAGVLVSPMVVGRRELIAGMIRDPQFGPCVMLGLGGIFAEALRDVAFAVAPLARLDASDLVDALQHRTLLGPFRGEPAVDRERLATLLEGLGRIGLERSDVRSIDVNPLIVRDSEPVVVDALVEMESRE